MVISKGQIFWCQLEPVRGHEQGRRRPVVVVSSDSYNRTQSPLIGIVPLTRAALNNPIQLALAIEDTGLETPSTALTDHARFIDRTRLAGSAIGQLRPVALANLNRQLQRIFGL